MMTDTDSRQAAKVLKIILINTALCFQYPQPDIRTKVCKFGFLLLPKFLFLMKIISTSSVYILKIKILVSDDIHCFFLRLTRSVAIFLHEIPDVPEAL